MDKIKFVNGQAPYMSDETLNQMQDNIEKAIDEKSSLPTGGTKGQILEKKSNEDNDVGWVDNTGGVTGDTLPIGTVVDFDGETVPENWEEVVETPEKVRLFKGTCNIGDTVELSEEPENFRIIFFRLGTAVTFPMCIQSPDNPTVLRASQGMAYGDYIDIYAANGTISDKNFTLVATNQIEINASGNVLVSTKPAVTEIWGIR